MTAPDPELEARLSELPSAGVLRRIGAIVYDGLLVLAMALTTTGVLEIFAPRPDIPDGAEHVALDNMAVISGPLLSSILFIQTFAFFAWFWVHSGRTLGMQAWHLRVIDLRGRRITPLQALKRFLAAIPSLGLFGLGYFWRWLDPGELTWPDRLSGSRVVRVPDRYEKD